MNDFSSSLSINKYPFSSNSGYQLNDKVSKKWPIVYILKDSDTNDTYIGETTNGINRFNDHLRNSSRNNADELLVISSDRFNKSATTFIESKLIEYMAADEKVNVENRNDGLCSNNNFYQKDKYISLFNDIWEKLKSLDFAKNDISRIDNDDYFKYSPFKSLSSDQKSSVINILNHLSKNTNNKIFIEGGAGTGKTVLATYLMKLLSTKIHDYHLDQSDKDYSEELELVKTIQSKFPDGIKIGLVVPMTSLRFTLKKVFRSVKGLKANMVIGPSEVANDNFDLLIVDESHRLKKRKNLTNYGTFDSVNERLGFDKDSGTELDWIIKKSSNQILFYDKNQSVRPTDIDDFKFQEEKINSHILQLSSQHRSLGGESYESFIEDLFESRASSVYKNKNYELILFEKIDDLQRQIKTKDKKYGLSRMLAGFSWEWKYKDDKSYRDITIENKSFKWNSITRDWINSDNAINEIGCIHTSQGYDLNYCALIFGHEISYDKKMNEIIINEDMYFDKNGKRGIKNKDELKSYIINIYKTMLLRAVKGTYIYVCNKDLKEYLSNYIVRY